MTTYDPAKFDWWEDKLAGKSVPTYNDTAMQGFYAFQPGGKKEKPKAVAFWYKDGDLKCRVDGQPIKYGLDIWAACSRNPISHEVYQAVVDGGPWPHEIRIEDASGAVKDSTLSAGPGHNSGASDEDLAALKGNAEEWTDRIKRAAKKGAPTTKEEADSVADMGTKLGDILTDAEAKRKAATDPLFKAYKDENAKWEWIKNATPFVSNAKSLAHEWVKAENKRLAAEAAAKNEAARKAAEEEAAKNPPSTSSLDPTPEPEPEYVAPRVTVGTRKAVGAVKRDVVVFEEGGLAKAAAYFCSQSSVSQEIYDAIAKAALKVLTAGVPVPGAKLEKKEFPR